MRYLLLMLNPIIFVMSFTACFFVTTLSAQSGFCGTTLPATPEQAPTNLESGCYPEVPGPFFIRIYANIIKAGPAPGTGGWSDEEVRQAVEMMREDFAPHNIFFVWDACNINVIADNALYTAEYPSLGALLSNYGHFDGINLFFFPKEEGMGYNNIPNGQATLPGKALYIGGEIEEWDGQIYTANQGRTLSHEMGHCLGLFHTFEQLPDRFPNNDIYCCPGPEGERADGSNGCDCGDYVDDTPAFHNYSRIGVSYPNCQFATTLVDCDNDLYNPDETNIMNYTYALCRNSFSLGQGARMRWVIDQGGLDPSEPVLNGVLTNGVFDELVVTNSDTWDLADFPSGFVTINNSLTVEAGVSLSISSAITVQFAQNAQLNVKPNALLELDGKLTGLCGSPWQGVYVWGNCNKGQSPSNGIYAQGRFVGKSNGTIENAETAVRNFGPTIFESGGQIRCTGTTFRNNRIGINFATYINKPASVANAACTFPFAVEDVSTLNGCIFETNDDYPGGLQAFEAFMRLVGVRGVKIYGPKCTNSKTLVNCASNPDECYGFGIKSINSGFRLLNSLLVSGGGPSKFKGLSYGIHVASNSLKPITISNAALTDCYKGIYASQASGIEISACEFFMGKVPDPAVSDRQFGTILYQTPTYKYRGNKAYGPSVNVEKTVGTCVNDCGDLNNVVFHNRYDDVMIGNVANLNNAGGALGEPRGLLYECNTNTGVYGLDFTQPAAGDVVRSVQGVIPSAPSDPIRAAGNKFSYNPAVPESDFSYHGGGILDYRYLPDNPQTIGDENQQPLDFFGLQTIPALVNLNCGTWPEREQPLLNETKLQTEKDRYYLNRPAYLQAQTNYQTALQAGNSTLAAYYRERAAYHRFEMDESASDVLHTLMRDTLNPHRDSIRQWMLQLETFGADLAVVLDDLIAGEAAKAQSAYNAIPNRFALSSAQQQDFNQFGAIVSVLSSQSMESMDQAAQQTLLGVAQQASGIAPQSAKSILRLHGFQFESPECALPECCQFGERGNQRNQIQQQSVIELNVYPNPAGNEVHFDLVDLTSSARLKVFDLSGSLLWVNEFQGGAIWQTANLPTGLYFYILTLEGEKTRSGKVSIIH